MVNDFRSQFLSLGRNECCPDNPTRPLRGHHLHSLWTGSYPNAIPLKSAGQACAFGEGRKEAKRRGERGADARIVKVRKGS